MRVPVTAGPHQLGVTFLQNHSSLLETRRQPSNERLAHLYEPLHPAILRSIRHTVESGHAAGRWVGICGEMAGDPRVAVLMVGLEVDELSMGCFDLPRVKAAIRSVRFADVHPIALAALAQPSAEAVRAVLRERLDPLLPDFLLQER